ncbi:MAG: calcium-binding protein [Rhodopirellula sp.]|nr:calcium-binding protein [Rhodopirellula sp.]
MNEPGGWRAETELALRHAVSAWGPATAIKADSLGIGKVGSQQHDEGQAEGSHFRTPVFSILRWVFFSPLQCAVPRIHRVLAPRSGKKKKAVADWSSTRSAVGHLCAASRLPAVGWAGGTGHDTLFGGHKNDLLYGDDGVDTLSGNYGNDVLDGGRDNDTLYGVIRH